MKRNRNYYIRKTHRYLGIFIGIQFIGWTVSGLYFSWTDIDEIHGDQFHHEHVTTHSPRNLISPAQLDSTIGISSLELRYINHQPHYWVNDSLLYNALTGQIKKGHNRNGGGRNRTEPSRKKPGNPENRMDY